MPRLALPLALSAQGGCLPGRGNEWWDSATGLSTLLVPVGRRPGGAGVWRGPLQPTVMAEVFDPRPALAAPPPPGKSHS